MSDEFRVEYPHSCPNVVYLLKVDGRDLVHVVIRHTPKRKPARDVVVIAYSPKRLGPSTTATQASAATGRTVRLTGSSRDASWTFSTSRRSAKMGDGRSPLRQRA
jgi:hypothetical protein